MSVCEWHHNFITACRKLLKFEGVSNKESMHKQIDVAY